MKKYLIFVVVMLMVSCHPSPEKKAEKLAKDVVLSRLYIPESYESVDTAIDSVYVSIYTDITALQLLDDYNKLISDQEDLRLKHNRSKDKYNMARSSVALYSYPYDAWSREQLKQAQEKLEEYQQEMNTNLSQLNDIENKIIAKRTAIKQRAHEIENGKFLGWSIVHIFRCANNLGVKSVSAMLIIADENIDNVLLIFSLEDDDKNSIQNIKKIIDEILEN